MKLSSSILLLYLLVVILMIPTSMLLSQSITAVKIPTAIAGSGGAGTIGSPYAVYVQITGWTVAANSQAYLKIYNGTNNEYMWSTTGVWSNATAYDSVNQPKVNIDGSGSWAGWIYMKHNNNVTTSAKVRAAKVGATSTNLTSVGVVFNVLDMVTTGGWIIQTSSPAVNKGILAYSNGAIVGSYRTEDNGITEGYSYNPGGYKIAVPIGIVDSLVTINDNGSRDQAFVGPWIITAGQETDAGSSSGQVGKGTALIQPSTLIGGASRSVTYKLAGESPHTITDLKVAVPIKWSWSKSTSDLNVIGGGSPSTNINGDTIVVSSMSLLGGDTIKIQINNITPPDSSTSYLFNTRTGTHPDSIYAIKVQPSIFVFKTPTPIVNIHINDNQGVPITPYNVGAVVIITGTVTANFSATQTNVFIQDATGGVDLYNAGRPFDFHLGDSLVLKGSIVQFRGLIEISPDFSTLTKLDTGRTVPQPLVLTCAEVNATFEPDYREPNEGRLIRINGCSYNSLTSTITDASGTTNIFIPTSFPPTPSMFDVIGILKQYKPGTPAPGAPYTADYEISPRVPEDIIAHPGPVVTTVPFEDSIQSTSVRINWQTDVLSSTMVYFGVTSTYSDSVNDPTPTTSHSIWLTGLNPATIYHYAIASEDSNGKTIVSDFLFSSASPTQTTGLINVYFNKTINSTVSSGEVANGNCDFTSKIVERINAARYSIDAALYSLSGTPGATVATALVSAKQRGVKVRVIGEKDNSNTVPWTTLQANGIPVIFDLYGVNDGTGLMHNKFFVIDYRGGAPDSVWLWTGSWNVTDPGTTADRQNVIEFQDVALAGTYTTEFEEMWGSNTTTPNATMSRFGVHKLDNTPHKFVLGGKNVESYFSPSDRTEYHISKTLGKSQRSINAAILTFTRQILADSIIAKKNAGKKIRVLMDNNVDTGNQFAYLQSAGVDVLLKGGSGLLHHKYAIIDAEPLGGTPYVITGSHNWSSSAETKNDENTVIVQNDRVANLYLQEFAARYYEAGGANPIVLGVKEIGNEIPTTYSLSQNYPNPFNPTTNFKFSILNLQLVTLKVFNVLGQEVATLVNEVKQPGVYQVTWDASRLASGVYYYQLHAGNFTDVKKMMLVR